MFEDIIESADRLVWAPDGGESGYVIIYNGENGSNAHLASPGNMVWDFVIMTDCAVTLGASDPGNTADPKVKAGGPIFSSGPEEPTAALRSFLSFLSHAAEWYTRYDMPDKESPEGNPPFNLEVRAWAYQNAEVISMTSLDMEG